MVKFTKSEAKAWDNFAAAAAEMLGESIESAPPPPLRMQRTGRAGL